jgi:hypothetical protein
MATIDRAYVALAIVLLIVGEALGIYLGITHDNRVRSAHIVLVLPGFVVLTLFGLLFRQWPAMKTGAIAAAQFWLSVVGVIGSVIGAYILSTSGNVAVIAVASVIMLAGAVLMLWLFWTRTSAA